MLALLMIVAMVPVTSLAITGGNFQVDGGLYYPTLQAAIEGAGSGTHTISVVTDITDAYDSYNYRNCKHNDKGTRIRE